MKKVHAKRSNSSSSSVQNLQPDSAELLVLGKTWKPEVHGRTPRWSSEFDEPKVSVRISRAVHESGKQGALRGVLEDRIEDGWTKVAL